MSQIKSMIAAILLAGSATANAKLTVTDNGLGVYDSGLNATWTHDANLLGTMEANAIAKYGNDTSLITDIINASGGVIHDTPSNSSYDGTWYNDNGAYQLTAADFGSGGTVDWWAGQAFVHYLNTQNYAGSNQWALPTTPDTSASFGYYPTSSQLGQLFVTELGLGKGLFENYAWASQKDIAPFSNVQFGSYWSGTERSVFPQFAWYLPTWEVWQNMNYKAVHLFYAWAVSPGQVGQLVSTVPEPDAVWLLGAGLLGLGLARRKAV